MTDNPTGPELFKAASEAVDDARGEILGSDEERYNLALATPAAIQALTAAVLMLVDAVSPMYEMEAWREVVPLPPLKRCRTKDARRPECAERHTEDCPYAEPPPEPKHVLLPVGTRVLVSDVEWDDEQRKTVYKNPEPGRISGYATANTKYRWQSEYPGGMYSDYDRFAFADNRVEVHPDGPECPRKEEL